jgi:hypothetical protein
MKPSVKSDWRKTRVGGFLRFFFSVLHYALVIFVLFGWIVEDRVLLLIHAALIPPMVVHWRFNRNRCIFSNIENWLKYDSTCRPPVDAHEPFIGHILGKLYRRPVSFRETQIWAHLLAVSAWLLGLYRLQSTGVPP